MSRNEDMKNFLLKHRARLNPEECGFSALNRRVKIYSLLHMYEV